jgi:hypothetical protein
MILLPFTKFRKANSACPSQATTLCQVVCTNLSPGRLHQVKMRRHPDRDPVAFLAFGFFDVLADITDQLDTILSVHKDKFKVNNPLAG